MAWTLAGTCSLLSFSVSVDSLFNRQTVCSIGFGATFSSCSFSFLSVVCQWVLVNVEPFLQTFVQPRQRCAQMANGADAVLDQANTTQVKDPCTTAQW